MNDTNPMDLTQPLLERLKQSLAVRLPAELVDTVKIAIHQDYPDFLTGQLTVEITCHVLGERLVPTPHVNAAKWVNFQMPATWWQHWKQDHKGTWYGRRIVAWWPIRLEIVTKMVQMSVPIERWRTFPQAEVPYPKRLGDMVPVLIPGDVTWIES